MKNSTVFIYFLFFSFLISAINSEFEDCIYQKNITDMKGEKTSCEYPKREDETDEIFAQKCFSFSNSPVFEDKCCYDPVELKCGKEGTVSERSLCPRDTVVHNNCGMAGIYEPNDPEICKGIALVEGYCCFVKIKDDEGKKLTACIRTKDLQDDIKVPSQEIQEYIKLISEKYTAEEADCQAKWIKFINFIGFALFAIFLI